MTRRLVPDRNDTFRNGAKVDQHFACAGHLDPVAGLAAVGEFVVAGDNAVRPHHYNAIAMVGTRVGVGSGRDAARVVQRLVGGVQIGTPRSANDCASVGDVRIAAIHEDGNRGRIIQTARVVQDRVGPVQGQASAKRAANGRNDTGGFDGHQRVMASGSDTILIAESGPLDNGSEIVDGTEQA